MPLHGKPVLPIFFVFDTLYLAFIIIILKCKNNLGKEKRKGIGHIHAIDLKLSEQVSNMIDTTAKFSNRKSRQHAKEYGWCKKRGGNSKNLKEMVEKLLKL